jgi:DNA-binding NarL/FixJ family response regulator
MLLPQGALRPPRHRAPGSPARVLLVDPIQPRCIGLRLLLEDARMAVFTAAGGGDALVAAKIVEPDAAVVELRLPDCDGLDLIRLLREAWPPVEILACSAAEPSAVLDAVRAAGALDVLGVATHPAQLVEAVREAVGLSRAAAELHGRR